MTCVYIVTYYDGGEDCILGVFTTRDKATAHIVEHMEDVEAKDDSNYHIEQHPLD